MKVFGGRLRFLGIGGAKLDTQAEQFMLEAKIPYAIGLRPDGNRPAAGRRGSLAGAARFDEALRRRACSCGWKTSIPIRSRARSWRSRRASCWATTRIPRRRPKSSHPTAGSAPATWAGSRPTVGFTSRGGLKNMIGGPQRREIYPKRSESVLNSHVFVADSLVTEKEGRLIALVHFKPRRAGSALRGAEIRLGDEEGRMGETHR